MLGKQFVMKNSVSVLAVLALAACARTQSPAAPDSADACAAADYQGLVGAQLAAVTLPAGLNMEIIEHGAAPPSPADPARMIFQLDAEGRISRVYCG